MLRRCLLAVAAAALVTTGAAACSDLVAGDSLVVQAATGQEQVAGLTGESTADGVTLRGVSGIAPCDYKGLVAADYAKYTPSKVTLAFSGNNQTACTGHKTGAALVAQYHEDLVWLTNYLTAKGAKVIYSAPLCRSATSGWSNGDPAFRSMEKSLATFYRAYGNHVAYSELAAQTICPGWTYVAAYRSSDGLHLNSVGAGIYAIGLRRESKTVNP